MLDRALQGFEDLINGTGQGHVVVAGDEVYQQPPVYLSFHTIEMRAAGRAGAAYDTVCATSGASALFAYEPNEMDPKYAHLRIGIDDRVAGALGFGYEWKGFENAEGAWQVIKESVDAGKPAKGWHLENVLFAGYEDAPAPADRKVLALVDGPGKEHPNAKFGLAGIEAYARDVADLERCPQSYFKETAWLACHCINPQWTARNATACYLDGLADDGVLGDGAGAHFRAAAGEYRAAFGAWKEFYAELGHKAPEDSWGDPERRRVGGEAAHRWLEHETAAIA